MGVVVDKIIDIVEEVVTLKEGLVGQGLLGSTVIQNKVTDLLDVEGVIRRVDPAFYDNPAAAISNNIEKYPVSDYGFQNSVYPTNGVSEFAQILRA